MTGVSVRFNSFGEDANPQIFYLMIIQKTRKKLYGFS
jgi:hypothetical protein